MLSLHSHSNCRFCSIIFSAASCSRSLSRRKSRVFLEMGMSLAAGWNHDCFSFFWALRIAVRSFPPPLEVTPLLLVGSYHGSQTAFASEVLGVFPQPSFAHASLPLP